MKYALNFRYSFLFPLGFWCKFKSLTNHLQARFFYWDQNFQTGVMTSTNKMAWFRYCVNCLQSHTLQTGCISGKWGWETRVGKLCPYPLLNNNQALILLEDFLLEIYAALKGSGSNIITCNMLSADETAVRDTAVFNCNLIPWIDRCQFH